MLEYILISLSFIFLYLSNVGYTNITVSLINKKALGVKEYIKVILPTVAFLGIAVLLFILGISYD